jgi:diacylglycerol kinase family enzyme
MGADTATPGRSVRGRRAWAWMALAGFAGLVVVVGAVVVLSGDSLITLVFTGVVCLLLSGAALWWALTTRKVWKRWLNLALVVLVIATLVIDLVAFSLWQAAGMLAIVVAALSYGLATRQALTDAAPAAPGQRSATPPARPWLLVNPRSGDGTAGRVGLVDGARFRGIGVHELAPGDDPVTLAREAVAAGADAVGVAGGDGSLGLIAAVAVELDVPFACVPAGTRNHFAHDLGLDRADPLAALDAFSGPERRIDVAMVGDRMFLNNVSLGAYADVVAEPGYRARKLATAHGVLQSLVRGERDRLVVEFTDPDGRRHEEVLVLLVANNKYQLRRASELGARDRLDEGVLQVSALRARTGAGLVSVIAKATVGRAGRGAAWAQWETGALRVDSKLPDLPAGVDGETVVLPTPLEFRILPRALRVLVPGTLQPPAPKPRPLSLSALRRLWVVAVGRASADVRAGAGGEDRDRRLA